MKTLILLALAVALVTSADGQTSGKVSYALPPVQNVTVGRNVIFFVDGAPTEVQWQVLIYGGVMFTDLAESSMYRGTKTKTLEIAGVTGDMADYQFRFKNTANGVTTTSSASTLTVSQAVFPMPAGIATDYSGRLYITDEATHTVFKGLIVQPKITYPVVPMHLDVSFLAGKTGETGSNDGESTAARFSHPVGVSVDRIGTVTLADSANGTIRQVSTTGVVATLAGSSASRGSQDGVGSDAHFSMPLGIARKIDGTFYVADSSNHTIRRVEPNGTVSTLAGSPGNAGYADGVGSTARFNRPEGVAVDESGNVYVADTANNLIRKITPAGVVSTLAGIPGVAGSQDGTASQATFNGPCGIAASRDGRFIFIADTGNSTIRTFLPSLNEVRLFAGTPTVSGMSDNAWGLLDHPRAIAVDDSNDYYTINVYIADTGNAAIRLASWNNGLETITLQGSAVVPGVPAPSPATTPVVVTTAPTSTGATSGGSAGGGSTGGVFSSVLLGLLILRQVGLKRRMR